MSLRRLLDRRVSIIPTTVTGQNARGEDVLERGDPIENVPTMREQTATDEDEELRASRSRTFRYFFLPELDDGTPLELTAYDLIVDGDDELSIEGEPELFTRRRRRIPSHRVAVARVID